MDEAIFRQKWSKNWGARVSLFLDSYSLDSYTKGMPKEFGKGIYHIVYTYNKGMATCYLLPKEVETCGKHLASMVLKDRSLIGKWCRILKKHVDDFREFLKSEPSKMFSIPFYLKMQEHFVYYDVNMLALKFSADHLPKDVLRDHLKDMDDARNYADNMYYEIDEFLLKVAKLLEKKTSIHADYLLTLLHWEFLEYLRTETLPPEEELRQRYEDSVVYTSPDGTVFQENPKEIKALLLQPHEGEIRGQTAFPGKAKGMTRIVLDPHRAGEFNEGDILIANMTRPDYIPLMEKAGAIVTDAGGVLCHAAIVAREMKKPCVIGTEVATEILKDGDLVEVDGEKGIVRKI
tara:strand:- start:537 stop:1577 length:1041 start_codon:yes stop_codon:yes gene_type:complete